MLCADSTADSAKPLCVPSALQAGVIAFCIEMKDEAFRVTNGGRTEYMQGKGKKVNVSFMP